MNEQSDLSLKDFYIVGVGASAGGLEALEELFDNMPTDRTDMAFVVIQHLSPDYQSMMSSILAKRTRILVHETTNGMRAEANHIYLIPPKKNMTIYGGKFYLTDRPSSRDLNLPIDIFLYSLAKDQGNRAVAIILSGTGSDGTRGIRSIKENDGMVMVQQAESAQFDGMPQNAIATGLADFILSPREMVDALVNFIKHPSINKQWGDTDVVELDNNAQKTLAKIMGVIKENTQIDFLDYKKNTLIRRVERRMGITQVNSMLDYLRLLYQDEQEIKTLCKEMLIGVTKFFRDPNAFEMLSQLTITRIVRAKQENGESIRVWVAGCSTGEEAYSIAILFAEYFHRIRQTIPIKIFATDIDSSAIDIAALGQYPESIRADLSEIRFNRFFIKKNNKYEIKSEIRRMIVFSPHDVTQNPPFGKIDLISCRNLFIYFQTVLQDKIFHLFHFSLKPKGFLFLGSSENISNSNLFTCLDNKYKIYQCKTTYERRQSPRRLDDLKVNIPRLSNDVNNTSSTSKRFHEILYDIVIEKYMPPSIIIDDNLDVVHTHGDLSEYLQIPKGIVSLNLSKMIHPSLAVPISVAFQNAKKRQQTITYSLSFQVTQEEMVDINVHIEPVQHEKMKDMMSHLWVIIFEKKLPSTISTIEETSQSLDVDEVHNELAQRNRQLEQELHYTRETLQAALEEVESSNEELQSTNEELLASNEELQSTNEELQAVNEELITVNGEHQNKIKELVELNDDMDNLLRSVQIGTVFLDRELRVKRFTNDIQEEINLRDSDIDRPFEHITHNLDYENLLGDLNEIVLGHGNNKRIRVKSNKTRKQYIMQISPYLIPEQLVQGAVLTLFNYEHLGLK
jgi:two-component system, chemotaxis family, CheB/CheR fusion protein